MPTLKCLQFESETLSIPASNDLVHQAHAWVEYFKKNFADTSDSLYNQLPDLKRHRDDSAQVATSFDELLHWAEERAIELQDREQATAEAKANAPQRQRDVFDTMHGITK
jgi:hypothetical protein